MIHSILCALALSLAHAEFSGVHYAHPFAWMHQPAVGEAPGWSRPFWINLETSQLNVWSKDADFTNLATGHRLSVAADFEQTSAILDFGFALGRRWAIAFEIPYANRNGGFMDDAIDQFHVIIQANRFLRNRFGEFGNSFSIADNGTELLTTPRGEGVGSTKIKLKYWWLRWAPEAAAGCACGVSFAAHLKLPVHHRRDGMSSGSIDPSVLVHVGVPAGPTSGVWFTAAYTRLGQNPLTAAWPIRRDQQSFELDADLTLQSHFGMVVQLRTESPLVHVSSLRFEALSSDPEARKYERISTAWNALAFWRTYEAFGVRWRWGGTNQINILATEDFGTGNRDEVGTAFYSNNMPDFGFVTQLHVGF